MRRLIVPILLCATFASAQDFPHQARWKRILFRVSQTALAAGNAADAFSSMGRHEINPVLGRGQFGGGQIAIKTAIVGGIMLGQEIVARKAPSIAPAFAVSNFGMAGYLGWQSRQNLNFPKIGAAPAQSANSTR